MKMSKQSGLSLLKLLCLSLILILNACANEETKVKELTFEDIEKGFGFERPLSEISKKQILIKYGSLDAYHMQLKQLTSKTQKENRTSLKASYPVELFYYPHELHNTICCDGNTYILDAAIDQCIDLPFSCRAGACSTCVGQAIYGDWDDSDQSFLDNDQRDRYFFLLCVTYPKSNLGIRTHMEDRLY